MTAARLESINGFLIPPSGGFIQTQYTQLVTTTSVAITANVMKEVDVFTVTITPNKLNSIIKLEAQLMGEFSNTSAIWNSVGTFTRDGSNVVTQEGSRECGVSAFMINYDQNDDNSTMESCHMTFFDTPNTLSEITYKVAINTSFGNTWYINRTVEDNNADNRERAISFISATEIAG
jgi:hypothetical protein